MLEKQYGVLLDGIVWKSHDLSCEFNVVVRGKISSAHSRVKICTAVAGWEPVTIGFCALWPFMFPIPK